MDEKCFETTDLKLAALILAELTNSYFKVDPQQSSTFVVFKIFYSLEQAPLFEKLSIEYLSKQARVDLFLYNRALRYLRNAIKDQERRQ